ncbi:MAG: glycoside hydrolase family 5 protein [Pseudomonadota bacterium]
MASETDLLRRHILMTVSAGLSVAATGCHHFSSRRLQRPVDWHGQLRITNGRVSDQHGNPLSIAGPSLFWHNLGWAQPGGLEPGSYYKADVVAAVLRDWNAPIIRAAIGAERPGGYIPEPDYAWQKLTAVADAAIDNGMYVIVDWHTHHAEDYPEAAAQFFTRVARRYSGNPNIIYEIYNEPLPAADWTGVIRPFAEPLIKTIRAIDRDNLIVVGTPSWSQDVDAAARAPLEVSDNLAYTLHFYAGTHRQGLRDKALFAMDRGLPLFVTEWGAINADGDGTADIAETERWMAFLREHRLSHCNWSLHSKAEGASILKPGTPAHGRWTTADLTATGQLTTGIMREWHRRRYRSI